MAEHRVAHSRYDTLEGVESVHPPLMQQSDTRGSGKEMNDTQKSADHRHHLRDNLLVQLWSGHRLGGCDAYYAGRDTFENQVAEISIVSIVYPIVKYMLRSALMNFLGRTLGQQLGEMSKDEAGKMLMTITILIEIGFGLPGQVILSLLPWPAYFIGMLTNSVVEIVSDWFVVLKIEKGIKVPSSIASMRKKISDGRVAPNTEYNDSQSRQRSEQQEKGDQLYLQVQRLCGEDEAEKSTLSPQRFSSELRC